MSLKPKLITPWRLILLNKFLRNKLHFNNTYWKIYGHWFVFKDHYKSNTTDIVFREIIGGIYKPQIELRDNDLVLDLGGHVGMFSIPLAKINPGVWFFVYEADPINYSRLLKNIKMNKVGNVFAFNQPVGKSGQVIQVKHEVENTGGSHIALASKETKSTMTCVSLEDIKADFGMLVNEKGRLHFRLMKMDIEGSEYDLISSANQLIGIEQVIAEVHGGRYGKDHNAMRAILETVRYSNLTVIESATFAYHTINGKRIQLAHMDG